MKMRIEPTSRVRRLLLSSPVGPLFVEYTDEGLNAVRFWEQGGHPPAGTRVEPTRDDPMGWRIAEQLREYFAGTRRDFDLPLSAEGTEFQHRVWGALCDIPFGQTRSYVDIAKSIRSKAPRAVGQANARNPIPIIVPCHRVLSSDGGIGGYMGSAEEGDGVALKRWLLRHEGVEV
jgi:methylated-DNA-[protein]-cysteine S-methyltransferase